MASNTTLNGLVSEIQSLFETYLYNGCFDCTDWNTLKPLLVATNQVPSSANGILVRLKDFLLTIDVDCGIGAQIDRLISVISDLIMRINSLNCTTVNCPPDDLFSSLLVTLSQTLLEVMDIIEYLNGILNFTSTSVTTDCECSATVALNFFMGRFINNITVLQSLMEDWYALLANFLTYSSAPTPSYVAAYVPRTPVPMPPAQTKTSFACPPIPCPQRPTCDCG